VVLGGSSSRLLQIAVSPGGSSSASLKIDSFNAGADFILGTVFVVPLFLKLKIHCFDIEYMLPFILSTIFTQVRQLLVHAFVMTLLYPLGDFFWLV
jgi:hypothetical protein